MLRMNVSQYSYIFFYAESILITKIYTDKLTTCKSLEVGIISSYLFIHRLLIGEHICFTPVAYSQEFLLRGALLIFHARLKLQRGIRRPYFASFEGTHAPCATPATPLRNVSSLSYIFTESPASW
jgi:hypothetical protein